jgi:hypothetical protein
VILIGLHRINIATGLGNLGVNICVNYVIKLNKILTRKNFM